MKIDNLEYLENVLPAHDVKGGLKAFARAEADAKASGQMTFSKVRTTTFTFAFNFT